MARRVVALHLADVTYPQGHPRSGSGPVFAFAVVSGAGVLLVDTGIGPPHDVIDRVYAPKRYALTDALECEGLALSDVTELVNTHLHFDHCGQNSLFPSVRTFVQAAEYQAAREPGYTVPEWVDYDGADYHLLDGDAVVAEGVRVIATPGHTPGHQSVIVETDEGPVVIAGQIVETAGEFRGAVERPADHGDAARHVERILALAPQRVYFSHDAAWWEPRRPRRNAPNFPVEGD